MFKKLIASVTYVIIFMFSFSVPTHATEITPYYLYTYSASSSLSISGTTATCTSTAKGYSGETTKIHMYQTLEKSNSNNSWVVVTSWAETDTGYVGTVTNIKSGLASGTYRLRTVFTVYAGSKYETIETISLEKTV